MEGPGLTYRLEVFSMRAVADPFLAEFDRLAQQVFGTAEGAGMPVDVTRRGDELVVRFDVPGVRGDAISLSLENHVLTVTATRHAEYGEDERVLVQERFDGTMTRRIRVPEWVDAERVAAEHADGVLTVVLPVAEQAKPRRIEIRTQSKQQSIPAA
ncbi:MAG: Hsp20/alpha crystallin family protein [Actinobacteria bacterium]|nr:Hsp20/alpha crystallin family protein [Actinomycetota bacterium]MCA1721306.1 Hsp20/alpha crystallin family protein [Actinomycetota bacterium]